MQAWRIDIGDASIGGKLSHDRDSSGSKKSPALGLDWKVSHPVLLVRYLMRGGEGHWDSLKSESLLVLDFRLLASLRVELGQITMKRKYEANGDAN